MYVEVFDVGDELEREGGHVRLDRVGARAGRFDDHVGEVVDDVGVVAGKTDHGVGIEATIEDVVVARSGSADQQVVAERRR